MDVRAYVLCAALVVLLAVSGRLTFTTPASTTIIGTFQLEGGHASRRELCFAVARTGTIHIAVEADTREPLAVIVSAGATVVSATRVVGSGEVTVTATASLVASAREWAVSVQPYASDAEATGRVTVRVPESAASHSRHDVDGWLAAHPAVAFHLTWRDAAGARTYSAWPRDMQQRLWQLVDDARRGRAAAPPDPPMNAWTTEDARELYLSTVAVALSVASARGAAWSVADLTEDELHAIFSSAAVFWRVTGGQISFPQP